ncbi:conserved oligomeric Golgi complex subunit 4-like isoform X2 [Gordionus sp. m RMFG-2023]|uniref:conserved oligomeric Golgi complex subunit 4-like isoform X2 n=1 Tax=Gordionus sp. m RMFG-2023 TaxID=3053472 RepID=UPI0031FC6F93
MEEVNLENLIKSHQNLQSQIEKFCVKLPSLQILQSNAQVLSNDIHNSWSVAEGVISKIRNLDQTRNRVQTCLRKVENLLNLKFCTVGVQMCMKNMDYEKAASHINKYLSFDETFLMKSSNFDTLDKSNKQLKESFEILNKCKSELNCVINQKFDMAIIQNDRAEIERYFKIYPLLKANDDGLTKFSDYLASQFKLNNQNIQQILSKIKNDKFPLSNKNSTNSYSHILTLLFENFVNIIETNQPLVEAYYGKSNLKSVLKVLQTECDKVSHDILMSLQEAFGLKIKLQAIHLEINCPNRIAIANANQPNEKSLSIKELDLILDEITSCITQTQYFFKFLETIIQGDEEKLDENIDSTPAKQLHLIFRLILDSGLNGDIQRLLADYITLEQGFMKKSFKKAEGMNHAMKMGSHSTSSIVDDTFFVIQKCVKRSISTFHVDGICAVVNHCADLFENDLADNHLSSASYYSVTAPKSSRAVAGNLLVDLSHAAYTSLVSPSVNQTPDQSQVDIGPSNQSGNTMSAYSNSSYQTAQQKMKFGEEAYITLNDTELSIKYLEKLIKDLEEESNFAMDFQHNKTIAKEKFMNCLSNFSMCEKVLQNILQKGLKAINENVLRVKTRPLIENFAKINHDITENEMALYEAHDPWLQPILYEIQSLITDIRASLTSTLFNKLISLYVSDIPIYLENAIMKTRFNRLGALYFDKELRQLVQEINDICNPSSNIIWKITNHDIKQILILRVDFVKQDVDNLKI